MRYLISLTILRILHRTTPVEPVIKNTFIKIHKEKRYKKKEIITAKNNIGRNKWGNKSSRSSRPKREGGDP